ncbi:MAG: SemiSWEET family sugar transporter [Gammaproteobacteria bacterium]
MIIQTIFGTIAFITTIIGLFPQVYKAIKTRSTEDISMLMLLNFLVCSIAWIIYGAYAHSFFVEMSNVIGFLSSLLLILLKYYYDSKQLTYNVEV